MNDTGRQRKQEGLLVVEFAAIADRTPAMWLNHTSFWYPEFFKSSGRLEHVPFAFWITGTLKPRMLVELGTHSGYSYFAFCQAIKNLSLETRCFAVNNWKGGVHAGHCGEDVFENVQHYNSTHYSAFSRLVRSSFDDALSHFPDASIDLLHVDGRHFYEDAKHDYETWRPKLSDRAVVLFHDTNVRERGFAVARLWAELSAKYPSFEFIHGHGLGVLGYGARLPPSIASLFDLHADPIRTNTVRAAYARLGNALESDAELRARIAKLECNAAQHRNEHGSQASRLAKLSSRMTREQAKLRKQTHALKVLRSSNSWRITAPLRALSRSGRQIVHNGRRGLKFARLLATGQFGSSHLPGARTPSSTRRQSKPPKAPKPEEKRHKPRPFRRADVEARAASRAQDLSQSATCWNAVPQDLGDDAPVQAFAELCRAHYSQDEYEKAEHVLERGRRLYPEEATLAVAHAEIAMAQQDWPEALRRWNFVIDQFVAEAGGAVDEGVAKAFAGLLATDDADQIVRRIQDLRARHGGRLAFVYAEGIAHLRAGKTAEARAIFSDCWQRVLRNNDPRSGPRLTLARNNQNAGKFAVAEAEPHIHYGAAPDRICVYTALFGDYDELYTPLFKPEGVDFVCFTDRPRVSSAWEIRVVEPNTKDPALESRRYKFLPWDYLPEYDRSLYVDSNLILIADFLLIYHQWLRGRPFVAWSHSERSSVYEECEAILASRRREPDPIIDEYAFLKSEMVPPHTGLIVGSVLWRDHRDSDVERLMRDVWDHIAGFSGHDQPGLGYLMWKTGIRPVAMPGTIEIGPYEETFARLPHRKSGVERKELRPGRARADTPCGTAKSLGSRKSVKTGVVRVGWVYVDCARAVASTIMRGYQLSEIARKSLGEDAQVRYLNDTEAQAQSGTTLFLTKGYLQRATPSDLAALKERGNILCADYVDDPARGDLNELIDVYIASSISQFINYSKRFPDRVVHHITHHVDPRLGRIRGQTDNCRFGYFGVLGNTRYRSELNGIVDFVPTNTNVADSDWILRLGDYNVHYGVRSPLEADVFKPFLKGFTAAHCHSNLLVTKREGDARYYLGSEYPYILQDNSLASVSEMLRYIEETFGGPEWLRGLEIMKSVRQRTVPLQIAGEIKELLARIS